MPITVPPFAQFQGSLFPLRGLWNSVPEEGDRYVAAELDWGSYPGLAIQLGVSGNSPVAITQIVALTIDNARCGSDVQFLFSDSGFVLSVPARSGGTYPVYTNSLSFYAVALRASPTDVTNVNIHNSMPPPVPVAASLAQSSAGLTTANLGNQTAAIVPAGVSGTLQSAQITVDYTTTAAAAAVLSLIDGRPVTLWQTTLHYPTTTTGTLSIPLSGLSLRFYNGLSLQISGSTGFGGNAVTVNAYYASP